jgi:hypothetical protein
VEHEESLDDVLAREGVTGEGSGLTDGRSVWGRDRIASVATSISRLVGVALTAAQAHQWFHTGVLDALVAAQRVLCREVAVAVAVTPTAGGTANGIALPSPARTGDGAAVLAGAGAGAGAGVGAGASSGGDADTAPPPPAPTSLDLRQVSAQSSMDEGSAMWAAVDQGPPVGSAATLSAALQSPL